MHIQQSAASPLGAFFDSGAAQDSDAVEQPISRTGWNTDAIGRGSLPFPQWPGAANAGGGITAILSQLMGLLQQLLSSIGGGAQQFFNSAQAASTGDPHLSFDGQTQDGQVQNRFDSMTAHADLLDSNSFAGGFQIGTDVTRPGANGVTYNRRASVTTDYGRTKISLDASGNARVLRRGKSLALGSGQSMQLSPRESVTRNADGAVVISEKNAQGGTVTTTLRGSGPGVDVSIAASGVQLGGDLVRHS